MAELGNFTPTLLMLMERLNWPVRMVRWRAAQQYGQLLSSPISTEATLATYYRWIRNAQLESEVTSALAVLFCVNDDALPPLGELTQAIKKPSILADIIIDSLYGAGSAKGGWESSHSGEAPENYKPVSYFQKHNTAHIAPIYRNELHQLEARSGLPFLKQWAFEWQCLADTTGAAQLGFPYHFVDPSSARAGVEGQFSVRQSAIYQSAYLRTFSCAVSCWEMPINKASFPSLTALPMNREIATIEPIARPQWLGEVPDICLDSTAALEPLVRELIQKNIEGDEMRTVSLRTPFSKNRAQYGSLSISAILCGNDASLDSADFDDAKQRNVFLPFTDGISIEGSLDDEDFTMIDLNSVKGQMLPLCANAMPLAPGYWHNDYFQIGIKMPGLYAVEKPVRIACAENEIQMLRSDKKVAAWRVWHDHWSPLYVKGGTTRCGVHTKIREYEIERAMQKYSAKLGWHVELETWTRDAGYGDFKHYKRNECFMD